VLVPRLGAEEPLLAFPLSPESLRPELYPWDEVPPDDPERPCVYPRPLTTFDVRAGVGETST
jgi:hypothetical protein